MSSSSLISTLVCDVTDEVDAPAQLKCSKVVSSEAPGIFFAIDKQSKVAGQLPSFELSFNIYEDFFNFPEPTNQI